MSVTEFYQKQTSKLPPYWKLALIRCSIYCALVGWGSFETGVDGYESFSDMTSMQFWKFVGNICVAMLGVWLAFLDQTLNKFANGQNGGNNSNQQQQNQNPNQT